MQITPYLNFDGDAEAAFAFYAAALGGELVELSRFGSMPPHPDFPMSDEVKARVLHARLVLPGGGELMASDTMPGMPRTVGSHVSISLHPTSEAEADAVFAALSEGGTVGHPLARQFWGDYFGSLTDRFGGQWMVNFRG